MAKGKVTNEQLLKAVKQGFKDSRGYTDQKIGDLSKGADKKIDDLARMVQGGFEVMDKKLDALTDDMRLVKGRLDAIEMELFDIKKKLATVIDRREFEILKDRVNNLER